MIWSYNSPRAAKHDDATSSVPAVSWAPDEIAVDGRTHRPMNRPSTPDGDGGDNSDALRRAQDEGFSRGYEEGFRAGELAEGARLRSAAVALQDALTSVQDGAERWIGNAEENICALAIAIARQVIGREVLFDQTPLLEAVRIALAEFPVDQQVTVRLNPSDLAVVSSAIAADANESLAVRRDVQWFADARIAPGGCLVDGRERIVDGRVDSALERLYRRLTYTGA
jgi:flagellar biosynthesis/type III secretory pathway protein FliH